MSNSSTGQQYTVQFTNNSNNDWDFCLYQQNPGFAANIYSLAWFTQKVNRGTQANFSWTIDYSFVWASTGELTPGVIFNDNQNVPADLNTSNQLSLSYNGNFKFHDQIAATPEGTLSIVQDNSIPVMEASVGIGMSGSGTFAVQAQPNVTASFTPEPTYWCTFGDSFQTGQVLESQQVSDREIVFPAGTYTMYVNINAQNILSVSATAPVSLMMNY